MNCVEVIVKCRKCGPLEAHLDLRSGVSKRALASLMEMEHGGAKNPREKKRAA